MFERPGGGESAIIVHIDFNSAIDREGLPEFQALVISAGVVPVTVVTGTRRSPDPKFFIGSGKAKEIKQFVTQTQADVVLFNHSLSPAQERNLERLLECRVLDRTGLILDIFAQRARSHEGKLQVELAQLQHLSTRLIRGWTHLERQKGGIGLRGPGETQLETDRRLLGLRIKQLNKRLIKVRRQREQGRKARKQARVPTVSLVGYTNAGKSTLFNRITSARVLVENRLFATLDPTLRRVELSPGSHMVLADTVGFIRHLPHDLVAAFRSTLQEIRSSDLLLHVIDACSEERDDNIEQVNQVLKKIDADSVPQIAVYNKIDQLAYDTPRIERDKDGSAIRVWLSAAKDQGVTALLQILSEHIHPDKIRKQLCLPPERTRLRAQLYELGTIYHEKLNSTGNWELDVELCYQDWEALCRQEALQTMLLSTEAPPHLACGGQAS